MDSERRRARNLRRRPHVHRLMHSPLPSSFRRIPLRLHFPVHPFPLHDNFQILRARNGSQRRREIWRAQHKGVLLLTARFKTRRAFIAAQFPFPNLSTRATSPRPEYSTLITRRDPSIINDQDACSTRHFGTPFLLAALQRRTESQILTSAQ